LLEAGVQAVEGDRTAADARLQDALARFERADMKLYAAVTRRRIGALRGGEGGRDILRQADDWMAGQDIRNAASITRMLAPGFHE
jgi:hypothetical protein